MLSFGRLIIGIEVMGDFCPLSAVPLEQANGNVAGFNSHLLWANTLNGWQR